MPGYRGKECNTDVIVVSGVLRSPSRLLVIVSKVYVVMKRVGFVLDDYLATFIVF